MLGLIISVLAYLVVLKINQKYQDHYIMVHNMTTDEYNKQMNEKMKNYNPYEPNELPFI